MGISFSAQQVFSWTSLNLFVASSKFTHLANIPPSSLYKARQQQAYSFGAV